MKIKSLITHPHVIPNPVRPSFIFRTQMNEMISLLSLESGNNIGIYRGVRI